MEAAVAFLLVAGLFCIFAPSWIMAASSMGGLEDEGCFVWGVRVFGAALVAVAVWGMWARG
jgi:hypothetical protein